MYVSKSETTRDQSARSQLLVLTYMVKRMEELVSELRSDVNDVANYGSDEDLDLQYQRAYDLQGLASEFDIKTSQLQRTYKDLISTYNSAFDEAKAEREREEKELKDRDQDEDYDIRPRRELSSDGSY